MRGVFSIILVIFFAACSVKKLEPLKLYTLNIPKVQKVLNSPYKNKTLKVVYPLSIGVNLGYKISYLYLKDGDGGYYVNSQFKETLSYQLTRILLDTLSQSGLFKSVVPYDSDIIEDLRLESTVFRVEHQVREDNSSYAVVDIEFRLVDMESREILKSKRFRYTKECKTTDAKGFIEALNEIFEELSQDLIDWLRR
ncbi:MAG: hypothetical protein GXN91_03275 [Epsilonproteobacteria bacterium]|nr:hypothetical protein [Campylobacterota bacterium]